MSQQNGVLESLVAALAANTAALEANTAALAGGSAPAGEKTTTTKTTKGSSKTTTKEPKSQYTKQQVTDAVIAVKDSKGGAAAKALLKDQGFEKLADITEDKFDALYAAAQEVLGGEEPAEEEDDI